MIHRWKSHTFAINYLPWKDDSAFITEFCVLIKIFEGLGRRVLERFTAEVELTLLEWHKAASSKKSSSTENKHHEVSITALEKLFSHMQTDSLLCVLEHILVTFDQRSIKKKTNFWTVQVQACSKNITGLPTRHCLWFTLSVMPHNLPAPIVRHREFVITDAISFLKTINSALNHYNRVTQSSILTSIEIETYVV